MNLGLIPHEDVCSHAEARTLKPLSFSSQKLLLIIVTTDYKVFNMGRNIFNEDLRVGGFYIF